MKQKHLEGTALIFAACEEADEDKRIFDMARAAGVLVNVPDKLELCDFIMPAILDRSPLIISISSAGASPILARVIKAKLETIFPASYGQLAAFVGRFRGEVMENIKTGAKRLRFWEKVIDGPVADMALAGDLRGAEEQMRQELDAATNDR